MPATSSQTAPTAWPSRQETSSANASAVPFSVVGTATGLTNGPSGLQLQLGALSVGLASVQGIATK